MSYKNVDSKDVDKPHAGKNGKVLNLIKENWNVNGIRKSI